MDLKEVLRLFFSSGFPAAEPDGIGWAANGRWLRQNQLPSGGL
jgi:hypothetical protein